MRKTLLLLCLSFTLSQAQIITETGFTASTDNTPFLLRANRYGLVPTESPVVFLNGKFIKEYDSTGKSWGLGYGLETHVNLGAKNDLFLPQAYLKARWKSLEIYAGRRKEIVGLVDTLLTSGSYIWSGNALPMPKIQIGMPEYTPLFKGGFVSIKWAWAHGWFDNNRPVTRKVNLHQKWFYARLGKPSWRIKMYAGANHQAQWGGYSPFFSYENDKLPSGWKNFWHVAIGTRGAIVDTPETLDFDANRVGNHLGTIDFGFDIDFDTWKVKVYRQNIYEDGSLFYLNNISDGLSGVSISLKKGRLVKHFNLEYMSTKSQGGDFFGIGVPNELRGRDNYFNNAQYRDGWTYLGNTIGTPMINTSIPWADTSYFLNNNRLHMFQWTFSGELPFQVNYTLRGNHSVNWGTYTNPLTEQNQASLCLLLQLFPKKNNTFNVNVGYDKRALYPESFGLQFSWVRHWYR